MNKFANLIVLFARIKGYFHTYDPANFSLIYTLKSAFGLAVVLEAAFLCVDLDYVIFSVFPSIFIFYMNSFAAKGWRKFAYLCIFAISCAGFALLMPFLIKLHFWLAVLFFFWVFAVTLLAGISSDLHKVFIYVTLLLMALLISATLKPFDAHKACWAILLGSSIAIVFRCYSPYSYGSYTRKSLGVILDDLAYMASELNTSAYDEWQSLLSTRIENFKTALSSSSANIKDSSLVRNQEMAMFYICKCEEIAYTLGSLRTFFRRNKHNAHIYNIQQEIIANLLELKKIFKDQKVMLQSSYLHRLQSLNSLPILCESLGVLYYKMQLFAGGGSAKITFSQPDSKLPNLRELLSLHNKFFRYALKCALACSCALLLASSLQIDHGIWIAMGTFTLFKEKINSTKINNKDTLIGSLMGFALGLLLIYFVANSLLVYPLLFFTYSLSIYFRHFPQRLAMVFIMANLAVYFCAIGLDYEKLIFYRLADFGAAYLIVLAFSALWPARSEHELRPALLDACALLGEFLAKLQQRGDYEQEGKILNQIASIKNLLIETRTKSNQLRQREILECLLALNNLAISMANYIDKHPIGAKERSDIGILATRFSMLQKAGCSLPAYMYENIHDKLLSEDEKMQFYCRNIFKEQSKLLKYL